MKVMDHAAYPASLRDKPIEALRYIRMDARNAMLAMPDGPNAGYYADEINYCSDEIARRSKTGETTCMT